MFAATFDIGANLLTVILAVLAAIPGVIAAVAAVKGRKVSIETGKQLINNGGSSALDKLQAGHANLLTRFDRQDTNIATIAAHVGVALAEDFPPPPPPVAQ
jgi:hypothetical protein